LAPWVTVLYSYAVYTLGRGQLQVH